MTIHREGRTTNVMLLDVNVLLYAHREGAPDHPRYRAWLEALLGGDESFAASELVLNSVVRVATNPRAFTPPSTLDDAFNFADQVRLAPNCVIVAPGQRHWAIFSRLCRGANARGDLVTDAYLAALAIESGSEWITTDRDFSRFEGLRWRHPLA